jgi:enediyne biosynthesis protein E4
MSSPEHGIVPPPDDAVPGRAFQRSLIVIAAVVVTGIVAWVWWSGRTEKPDATKTDLTAPELTQAAADVPGARFKDITAEAGIKFVHLNGARGEKLLPETMGGGVAFLDFDNDGAPDLLFVSGGNWPWRRAAGLQPADPNRRLQTGGTLALYRNDGRGRFTDVTAGSGLEANFYGAGVAVGDFDNDGLVDVFITGVGENHLFRNRGGSKFEDVSARAGMVNEPTRWSTSAAFVDYDNDGRLDLFVCNYVKWSREIDRGVNYTLPGIGRAYGPPLNFEGSFPLLYHNEGQGRFRVVSREAGLQITNPVTGAPMAKSLGVAPVDLNNDGWIDFVVANDQVQNFVLSNRHNGTFAEVGAQSGVAFDPYGLARGAMGIDSARFRNDNALGIAIGNFANEPNALYVAQNDSLLFADEAITEGIGPASRQLLKFGLFFFDYDLDGRLDVLTANGHLEEEISKLQKSQSYRQPAQLFWNRSSAKGPSFVPVPPEKAGDDLFKPIVGRGSAYADIDGDGDLDVVLTQVAGPPLLLRNDQRLGHHWLRLKLVGSKSNRDAIGAWVKVRVEGRTLAQQVMPAKGYLSQSEPVLTFGLGKVSRVDSVEITWPGGAVQKVSPPRIDALTVTEGRAP